MKKGLLLLPLVGGMMLAGCDLSNLSNLFKKDNNQQQNQGNNNQGNTTGGNTTGGNTTGGNTTGGNTTGGDDSGTGGGNTTGGGTTEAVALKTTLNYASLKALTGDAKGYAALANVTQFDGHAVSFENVMINELNSSSQPAWNVASGAAQVIQFKNPNNGCGVITFTNVKATKVVVNLLTSYDINGDFVVSIGGTSATLNSDSGVATDYKSISGTKEFDIKKYALTFNLGSGQGDLVIKNAGQGARYVESIVIE